jgi:hypothetical protein
MTRGKSSVRKDVEMEIVRQIYTQMVEMDWAHIPDSEHTEAYTSWTSDPRIGGRLLPYLTTEQDIRVWIKDGPIKEHPRAIYGIGRYAACVSNPATPVQSLVTKALGSGWSVDMSTLKVKPLTVTIHREEDEGEGKRFAWGPTKTLKHLVWAAIQDKANGDPVPWVLCLTESFGCPSSTTDRLFHANVADLIGVTIKHVSDG